MFRLQFFSDLPALLMKQSASARNSHWRVILLGIFVTTLLIFTLLPLQTAHAGDTKILSFTNRTGKQVSGLHVTFRGKGDVVVNPYTIVSPSKCDHAVPSSSGNAVDIVWQTQGCVQNNSTVSFTVTSNGPDSLEFGEGYWTGPAGARIANVQPGDVEAESTPSYRLLVPDLAEEGEQFTGMVVEETPKGNVPLSQSDQVVFNGKVLPQEPEGEGRFGFPPFEQQWGNYFMGVIVVPRTLSPQKSHQISLPAYTQHVEILPRGTSNQPKKPQIARSSSVVAPGAPLRVEGQNLQLLKRAALVDEHSNQIPIGDSVGSSLQRIYLPTADAPISSGTYRYVAWDAAGNRYDSPNISRRARLQLNGPQINKRGQQGEFTITSDMTGMVELAGGEPIISLAEHTFGIQANQPRKVKFTAQEVGQYTLNARLYNPEDLPQSARAPKVDCKPEPITAHYDPKTNQTSLDASVTVTNTDGRPAASVGLDMALSRTDGIEYSRLTTDDLGRATLRRTLSGNVPVSTLSTHVYRVMDYNWKEPGLSAGHPTTIAGLGTLLQDLECRRQCKVPEVSGCKVDHIHVHLLAGLVKDFDLEWANSSLDVVAVMEGVASVIEPNPGSGASGVTLGATELAKGLVEELDKRRDTLKAAGDVTVTLVLQRSYCIEKVCYIWPKKEQIWQKETFDDEVKPPDSMVGSKGQPYWAGLTTFDLRDPQVRQALLDAYERALKKCEGQ